MHPISFGNVHTAGQRNKPPSSPHAARPSESKWSPSGGSASNSSLAHELWKVPLPPKALSVAAPTRPPPGLTSQKLSSASSGWDSSALRLGGWGSSESRYTPGKNRKHTRLNTLVPDFCWGCSNFIFLKIIINKICAFSGSSWSDSSSSGRTQWLVLKNLTPQVILNSFSSVVYILHSS